MLLPEHSYVKAESLKDCLERLRENGEKAMVVAGGTDVIFNMRLKLFDPDVVVSIRGVEELEQVEELDDGGLRGKRIRNPEGGSTEAYAVFVGGKLSEAGRLAEELCDATDEDVVAVIRKILDTYLEHRTAQEETFIDFCERIGTEQFREILTSE